MAAEDNDEFVETSLPGFAEDDEDEDNIPATKEAWVMKKLKPVHLQICALLAQGMKNVEVASATSVTPEYVSMLMRQPLIQEEVMRISQIAGVRLEAMFHQSVEVIGEVLRTGTNGEKLKAVRVHGELTKRIGRADVSSKGNEIDDNRLVALSERLLGLMAGSKQNVIEGKFSKEQAEDV
mgnify:CR=1 FL=1